MEPMTVTTRLPLSALRKFLEASSQPPHSLHVLSLSGLAVEVKLDLQCQVLGATQGRAPTNRRVKLAMRSLAVVRLLDWSFRADRLHLSTCAPAARVLKAWRCPQWAWKGTRRGHCSQLRARSLLQGLPEDAPLLPT